MALGVPAGPRVGELLRGVEAWWIAGNFAAADRTANTSKWAKLKPVIHLQSSIIIMISPAVLRGRSPGTASEQAR